MTFFEFITSPLMGVYFLCAVFGGTLVRLQLILIFFGICSADGADVGDVGGGDGIDGGDGGGGGDDYGHSQTLDIFKILSLRTIIAGFAFFGLGGLAGLTGGTSKLISVVLAVISGFLAMYIVYYLYLKVANLKFDGSISHKTLVGAFGNVYLKIPAAESGQGKVLVNQQDRTMEYEAVTTGDEIKTGTPIVVIRIVSPTTVEVKPNL
jgi:membrane protein implicated in regulation of membrane protease activity